MRESKASQERTQVSMCHCGKVYLTLGSVTVKLSQESFLNLAGVLGEAAKKLVNSKSEKGMYPAVVSARLEHEVH